MERNSTVDLRCFPLTEGSPLWEPRAATGENGGEPLGKLRGQQMEWSY